MKKIILTIDYELFLGKKTGSVEECMIKPTYLLSEILAKNESKMTVFGDVLHYYRLMQLSPIFPELLKDQIDIKNQVKDLLKQGHDIQIHLHPHWLDAKYEKGSWNFTYQRFKLHNLLRENNIRDINIIAGCIAISKQIIEDVCNEVVPGYKVTTFRAGGYLIEPFEIIKEALEINNIFF